MFVSLSMIAWSGITAVFLQLPFITVDKGFSSGIRERSFVIIKTQKEWENLWRAHKVGASSQKKMLPIDFEAEMIVAVFLGEKRTGGYGMEITKVEEDSDNRRLNVYFRETQPPPSSIVTQALTQPYHIMKLRTVSFPVVFVPLQEPSRP